MGMIVSYMCGAFAVSDMRVFGAGTVQPFGNSYRERQGQRRRPDRGAERIGSGAGIPGQRPAPPTPGRCE